MLGLSLAFRSISGRTLPKSQTNYGRRQKNKQQQASQNIRPLVLPHVSHFMQVPFGTSLELPHSLQRQKPVLGLRGFRRGRGVAWPRRAVGPEEGDRGEVAKSAVQSNEMPVAPDRVCPIGSSPVFRTVRRSNRSGFAPLEPAAIGRPLRAGVADRSEHVPHLCDRLVRSDAGRRILRGDGEGALAHAGRPASIRRHPLLRRDLWVAVSLITSTGGARCGPSCMFCIQNPPRARAVALGAQDQAPEQASPSAPRPVQCLQSERMRRTSKKHCQILHGVCPMCGHQRDLLLKADYSFYHISAFPPRVLPEEKKPRQLGQWPAHMRFD
jgi:hypothetical protein